MLRASRTPGRPQSLASALEALRAIPLHHGGIGTGRRLERHHLHVKQGFFPVKLCPRLHARKHSKSRHRFWRPAHHLGSDAFRGHSRIPTRIFSCNYGCLVRSQDRLCARGTPGRYYPSFSTLKELSITLMLRGHYC
jgi:hypothetical protein